LPRPSATPSPESGPERRRRRDTLFGRRKGKPLSPRRETLMAERLPALLVDIAAPVASPVALFSVSVSRLRVEIGFGGGEHLVAEALAAPDTGFIGVEPFLNGMAKAVDAIDAAALGNVRLFGGDAARLLDWLPAASVDAVDLLYPDPWPKKRHWKRRFVSPENLERFARVLKPGGALHVASDIPSYIDWTLILAARNPALAWTAERADDWRMPFSGWSGTRYERKATAAGRVPAYLAFRRL
jgi:tRNA (guanine-N7-)-methyltransferase